jgi:hypothetical protein
MGPKLTTPVCDYGDNLLENIDDSQMDESQLHRYVQFRLDQEGYSILRLNIDTKEVNVCLSPRYTISQFIDVCFLPLIGFD